MASVSSILIRKRIKTQTEYRFSFLAGSFGAILGYFAQILVIVILVDRFKTIGGWGPWEVAFLYGMNLTAYTLGASFFYHFRGNLSSLVATGQFDELLIRPINPMVYLMLSSYTFTYLFRTMLGMAIVIISLIMRQFPITAANVAYILMVTLSGGILQAGFFLLFSVPTLWQVKDHGLGRLLWDFKEFTNYPLSIFPKIIQFLLTFVVPYGFVSYFPAEFVFQKETLFGPAAAFLSFPVGVLLFGLSYLFWNWGLKRYESTGS